MAPMTMPAMAPEDSDEDELEVLGIFDGVDVGEDEEEVMASALDISGSVSRYTCLHAEIGIMYLEAERRRK